MTDSGQKVLDHVKKAVHIVGVYLQGVYHRFYTDTVFVWAGAIAFKVLLTFVPLTVLSAGLTGLVLRQQAPFVTVTRFLESFLPGYGSDQAIRLIRSLAEAGQTITIIGILGLVASVITLFSTLRIVVASVFKRESHSRSLLHGYLFDLRMALQVGLLFLLSILLTVFMRVVTPRSIALLHRLNLEALWLEEGWYSMIQTLGWLFPFVVTTIMFFLLYHFVPLPRPSLRSSWTGAWSAGVLWELLKTGFTYVAEFFGYVERFENTVGQVGMAFGLALALLLWVYYSGLVLIIGAEVSAIYEERHLKSPRLPTTAKNISSSPAPEEPQHAAPDSNNNTSLP